MGSLKYGRLYHIQNGFNTWKGGYLDTRGGGCEDNALCVSTAASPDRQPGALTGKWKIVSAAATPKADGQPVLSGDLIHLQNQYDHNGQKTWLDTRGRGCQDNFLCVSTATSKDRDQGSGTWRIILDSGGGEVPEGEGHVHLQNIYKGSPALGGFLDTRGSGCAENLLCVSTSSTWERDLESTHWRFGRDLKHLVKLENYTPVDISVGGITCKHGPPPKQARTDLPSPQSIREKDSPSVVAVPPQSFSVWGDADRNNNLNYCLAQDFANAKPMRGGDKGGAEANILLHVAKVPELSSLKLTPAAVAKIGQIRKNQKSRDPKESDVWGVTHLSAIVVPPPESPHKAIAHKFTEIAKDMNLKDMLKSAKTPQAKMGVAKQASQHRAYGELHKAANEAGYKSIGFVSGGGISLGIGGEASAGVLTDIAFSHGQWFAIESIAITLGAEEEVAAFAGVYLSNEEPSEAYGWEFFAEAAAGFGIGVAVRLFAGFVGAAGQVVLVTGGEELELSVGVGYTNSDRIN